MNELFARIGYRTSGFILSGFAALLVAFGLWTMVSAVFRWMAVTDLRDYQLATLGRDRAGAAAEAQAAAQAQPRDAVCVLPALDLAKEEDQRTLERLLAHARPGQRDALQAAAAFGLALRGKPPGEVGGDDGALIAYLPTIAADGGAHAPKLPGERPPHRGILAQVLLRRFQATWTAGVAASIRDAAAALLLLDPRQPDAGRLHAILLVLSARPASFPPGSLNAQLSSLVNDSVARLTLVRQLIRLSPAHAADLSAVIPPEQQSAEERTSGSLTANGRLDDQVRAALTTPNEGIMLALLPRVLSEGRADLARPLIAQLRNDLRPPFATALAQAEGDLDTLVRLGGDAALYQARISAPLIANGRMSFHLSCAAGIIPHAPVEVRIDGRTLSADKITRFGSLVVAELGGATTAPFEVRLADKLVASGKLAP